MGAFAFGDEMRVGLIGCVRRVWAPRGVKIEMPVEYQYAWAYLNLAVNGLTGHLLWDWTENLKAESLAPVARGSADQGGYISWFGTEPVAIEAMPIKMSPSGGLSNCLIRPS